MPAPQPAPGNGMGRDRGMGSSLLDQKTLSKRVKGFTHKPPIQNKHIHVQLSATSDMYHRECTCAPEVQRSEQGRRRGQKQGSQPHRAGRPQTVLVQTD